jgi:flagellin-specific chaperone FliS
VRDAVAALEAAISELRQAEQSLPDDMTEEVQAVIAKAEAVLEALLAREAAG